MAKSARVLQFLGRPFFHLLLHTIAFLGFIFLFSQRTLQLIKLPKLSFSFSLRLPHQPLLLFLSSLFLIVIFYYQILKDLPSPKELINRPQKLTTQILDRNGTVLYKIYQDENRTPIKLNALPPYVQSAFLAIEDNNFYRHHGVSLTGIVRALIHNLFRQNALEGGSTITQQLVKNALLSREKTWTRKIKEVILALKTETVFDKNAIFEMYLNEVGFGGTAYGIEEASQQYFGKTAAGLTLNEAAFLAGMPKSPSRFSPYDNADEAIKRQRLVLVQMRKNNYLNDEQFEAALNTPLVFTPRQAGINAPHFVMFIRDLLIKKFGEDLVYHTGLKVTTSLDLPTQNFATTILKTELNKIKSLNVNNGAILITQPKTGQILAMVGSKDYFDTAHDGQVNLTTALRQPGSAIKPVNYALALENGLSPNTIIQDTPVSFNIPGAGVWTPQNYDGRFHGNVTLRQALANSYNIPAILLLSKNGIDNMISLGQKMGITTWSQSGRYGLALTLGSAEVQMTDMAVVYGTLANQGLTVPLNPILQIEDSSGRSLSYNPDPPRQTLKPETAFLLSDILADRDARSAAFGLNSVLNLKNFTAAVKTGTSNNLRDNWTIGYTPDFVVAAWVGNNDNSPMSRVASGITGASPIWNKIMTSVLEKNPHNAAFSIPGSLVKLPICTLTGTLTCAGCPTRYEYYPLGAGPKTACNPDDIQKIIDQKKSQQASAQPTPLGISATH